MTKTYTNEMEHTYKMVEKKFGVYKGDLIYSVDIFGDYQLVKVDDNNIFDIFRYFNKIYFRNEETVKKVSSHLKADYMAWLAYDIYPDFNYIN